MSKNIGILYLCTGRYILLWKDFYESSQKYLLTGPNYQKSYFVFTDAEQIAYQNSENVHRIFQEQLAWPLITLFRFKIFQKAFPALESMDYLFFFNSNMLFVDGVGEEILPTNEKPLAFLLHPGMIHKDKSEYTYERDPRSLAYVPNGQGIHYYAGGLNGGLRDLYMTMVNELSSRIEADHSRGIIAVWHDESHLNKFAIENQQLIKNLPPEYGWPQGWKSEIKPKILILDKNLLGGHDYLRGNTNKHIHKISYLFKRIKKTIGRQLRKIT